MSKLEELLSINTYGTLFVEALRKRSDLINILRNEKSPLLDLAESIQHDELQLIQSIGSQSMGGQSNWTFTTTKKSSSKQSKIKLNGKDILATIVTSFDAVDNTLCYVQPHNHFAIRINNTLLHGNIGKIVESRNPEKIKSCKIKDCRKINCSFYHDPMDHDGSECRNYVKGYSNIIDDGQLSKFSDRIMHDLLTLLTIT